MFMGGVDAMCEIISLSQEGCSKECVEPGAEWTMFQERRVSEWNTELKIIGNMSAFFLLVSE